MAHACICYTTDRNYFFPTLVSAIQARRYSSSEKADILVFAFGLDPRSIDIFGRICDREALRLVPLAAESIESAPAMLARLFLADIVPIQYSQFLYIDGDTQIVGSIDPLLDTQVPSGNFLAADDTMMFMLDGADDRTSQAVRRHFRSIGYNPQVNGRYFNSGVLRINREGWSAIGMQAWELYRKSENDVLRFPDQDCLNVAGGALRLPLSFAWNFPIFMRGCGLERSIAPVIYHFCSAPKPWQGTFPPWNAEFHSQYRQIIRRYPELSDYRLTLPPIQYLRYHAQQRYKHVTETFCWRLSDRRHRVLEYEKKLKDALSPC